MVLFDNFRLDCLVQNRLVLVRKPQDCLVSSRAQAVQASHSHRRSHSRLLEAACLVQKRQHLQGSEVSEQQEPLASVCITVFVLARVIFAAAFALCFVFPLGDQHQLSK